MRGRTPTAPALQPSRRRRRAASAQARRRGACVRQPPHRPRPLAAAASRCRFGGWVWPAGPAPPRQPTRGRGRGAAGACCPMRGRGAFGGSVGGGSRRHESHPARTGCCWPCCAARCSAAPRPRRPVSTARAPLRPGPPLPLPRAAAPRQREPGPPAAVAAASEPPGWTPPPPTSPAAEWAARAPPQPLRGPRGSSRPRRCCTVRLRPVCLAVGRSSPLPLQHLLDSYQCSREDDHLSCGETGMPVPPFGCAFSAGKVTFERPFQGPGCGVRCWHSKLLIF